MRKIAHTMLRVGDMRRSVAFYTDVLGMRVLRTLDQPEDCYSLTFLGFGSESDQPALELTYNYGVPGYDLGNGYGHIAIEVDDCNAACDEVRARGGVVLMDPFRLKVADELIAFVSDPDGYQIELIQRLNP